jgi:hypothetical protein
MQSTGSKRLIITAVLAALCAAGWGLRPAAGAATGPTTWVQSSYEDFSAGDLVSVSLDHEGQIRLAPELALLGNANEAYVWAVDEAPDGSVFASAGTEGRIYRFPAGADAEDPSVFFDAEGTVYAMALGPDGYLYAAASPGGDIWRLPLSGGGEVDAPWFSTATRYVWSLAFDADGNLYAGTGDGGVIHRVTPDGTGEVLYDSNETHITALSIDSAGNLLVGSSDSGHLYRVSPAGDVFVLFDSPMKQITGIVPTASGVFFAALEQGAGGESTETEGDAGAAIGGSNSDASRGAVYLLHDDGLVEQVWSSGEQSPHAMEAAGSGVVVGTGSEGRLFHVDVGPATTVLGEADAAQITALRARGEDVIVGTSNLGRVYRLRDTYGDRGEYVSQVKDTATTSRWGRLRWRGDIPAGTSVRMFTRSGNTADPDETWSDWSEPYNDPTGSPIGSPPARFVQWKAELAADNAADTPVLQWVELVYVQRNLRPEIDEFTVHPAGVIYRQNTSLEDALPIGRLPSPVREALARQQGRSGGSATAGSGFLGQAYYLPGSQTFTWDASDANGDQMSYVLLYRGESETEWKPVASRLSERLYLWDTTTVPDGLYRARLVVSDAPSNPSGEELEGTRSSPPLVIDNTAPRVDNLSATREGDAVRITGTATDETSLIRAMEYAVDGGEWRAVLPADGLPDAGSEEIGFSTVTLLPGEHTIVVRVTDTALNSGTAKVVVDIR